MSHTEDPKTYSSSDYLQTEGFDMVDYMRWEQDWECGWYNEMPCWFLNEKITEKLTKDKFFEKHPCSEEEKEKIIQQAYDTYYEVGVKNSNENFVALMKHLSEGKSDM